MSRTRVGLNGRLRAFAALAALALVLVASFAATASALPARYWGVVPQTALSQEQFERLQKGGVRTMRVPFDWGGLQQAGKTVAIDWTGLDLTVERAARANIELLPFLTGAPSWAVPSVSVPGDPNAKAPARLPVAGASLTAWKQFVREAVARYGTNGSFWTSHPTVPRRPVRFWQVWNEPNFKYFVARPNPAEYGRLLKLTSATIKAADPSAKVVLAGLFALPKGCLTEKKPKSICATDFITQMYKRTPGIKSRYDAVALHPYSKFWQEVGPRIDEFRRALTQSRDGAKPLWITELSWSSQAPNPANTFAKGVAGQAKQLQGAFGLLRSKQAKWKIQRLYWFSVDDATGTCNFCDGSGLFGDGFVPKKAWFSFVKFTGGTP